MKRIVTPFLLASLAISGSPLQAEEVFIPSYIGTTGTTDAMPCPPSCPVTPGFTLFGASNFSASQANPAPVIPNNARRIIYGNAETAAWSVTPTDITVTPTAPAGTGPYTFSALKNIGVYRVYLTKGQTANASTNIVVALTAVGGDLATTNGVAASSIELDIFQRANTNALHKWMHVAYLTNSTYSPTLTLTWVSGAINDDPATSSDKQRWYVDAWRFEYMDQCSGVAGQVGIDGPLVQGQTFVNVNGVAQGATNVTVYARGSFIGEATHPTGFAAGAVRVTTSALIKGDSITAGQIKNGCSSIVPGSGPEVGGGPNAALNAFLGLWKNVDFTGPVGINAPTNLLSTVYFLKATGFTSGFGTAPAGGEVLNPGTCWQTVTFNHATDTSMTSTGSSADPNTDPFAALEGLIFGMGGADSGPYDIYVDEIKNGEVMIEDFEGYAAGATNHPFAAPNRSASPNPSSTYLAGTNSAIISQANVFQGTNALRLQWQWAGAGDIRWAHILANNAASGKVYPMIDTTKPITLRYLVLPVGETASKLSFQAIPMTQTKSTNQTVTFTVQPVGTGPFTYQWYYEGNALPDTGNSLTKSNLQLSDSGVYSVQVTGGTGCQATLSASLNVVETVPQPTLGFSVGGGKITFTWQGSFTLQRSTAVPGGWADVATSSGYEEPLNQSSKAFFRLRQ